MSEDKGLQEADMATEEVIEDLSSFVDLADLDELEYKDNEDVFGGLGDIADLGEMPDLSLDTVSDSQEAAGAQMVEAIEQIPASTEGVGSLLDVRA